MTPKLKPGEAVPAGLGKDGTRLWRAVVADFELGQPETALLENACRTADVVARLAAELAAAPLTVPGSKGQPVPHPLLAQERQARALLARLLGQLRLADAEDDAGGWRSRSAAGRRMAVARWHGGR